MFRLQINFDPNQSLVDFIDERRTVETTTQCLRIAKEPFLDHLDACKNSNGYKLRKRLEFWEKIVFFIPIPAYLAIELMFGPVHALKFITLIFVMTAFPMLLAIHSIVDARSRKQEQRFVESNVCLRCGISRTEHLDRCWNCESKFIYQDRIRRQRRHRHAVGLSFSEKAKRCQKNKLILAGTMWAGIVWLIIARTELADQREVLLLPIIGLAVALFAFFLTVYCESNRVDRSVRDTLIRRCETCINCDGDIDGFPDDDFCPHCDASLLKRRWYFETYGVSETDCITTPCV